jgi:tripartite-type tricarboxylate transporter receptor subunit TctC
MIVQPIRDQGESMIRINRTYLALYGIAVLMFLATSDGPVAQTSYPDRPIRLLYGFPPGADLTVRVLADKLSIALGKPVVVENVTGAAGGIAADRTAKAAPDGYTLGVLSVANIAINPNLYNKLSYDPVKDLKPVARLWGYPNVLFVNNDLPAKSVQELVAYARANPGKVAYAHSGLGTTQHLGGELMKLKAGVELQQVPYRGPPQIITDLVGGRISMAFLNPGTNLALAREGKIRALAVTSRARVPFAPDLPTMIETGFPDFDMTPWFGMFVPPGTPQPIIERLHKELDQILAMPDVRKKMQDLDVVPLFNTPEEFATVINVETLYWAKTIKDLAIPRIDQ